MILYTHLGVGGDMVFIISVLIESNFPPSSLIINVICGDFWVMDNQKRKVSSASNLGIEIKLIDRSLEIRKISDPKLDP